MNEEIYCYEIDWIVDFFGTDIILEYFINPYGGKISTGRTRFPPKDIKNGLYYSGAHWYAIGDKDNNSVEKVDSYMKEHQIKGTAHFCQTFALLYYLKLGNLLKKHDYSYNIKVAVQFWLDNLENDLKLRKIFIKEVNTEDIYKDRIVLNDKNFEKDYKLNGSKKVKNYKWTEIKKFLLWVQENSDKFINCKQG